MANTTVENILARSLHVGYEKSSKVTNTVKLHAIVIALRPAKKTMVWEQCQYTREKSTQTTETDVWVPSGHKNG